MEKNFNAASRACDAKASEYKKDKVEAKQQKAQDAAAAKAVSPRPKSSGSCKDGAVWYSCGKPARDYPGSFVAHRKKDNPGKDKRWDHCQRAGSDARFTHAKALRPKIPQ